MLEVGDTVQLKSGGPNMTIRAITNIEIHCTWFVAGINYSIWLPPDCLTKVKTLE